MSDATQPRKTRRERDREHRQAMLDGRLEPKLAMTTRLRPSYDGSLAKTGMVTFVDADGSEPVDLSVRWEDGHLVISAKTPYPVELEVTR